MIQCPEYRLFHIRCILFVHIFGLLFIRVFSQELLSQHTQHQQSYDPLPLIFRKPIIPIPIILYNVYDKLQPAIALTSLKKSEQLQQLFLAPSYSLNTNHWNMTLLLHVNQTIHPPNFHVNHYLHIRNYSYFLKGDTVLRYVFFSYKPMLAIMFGTNTITFSLTPLLYCRDKLTWNNDRGIYETSKEHAWFLKIDNSVNFRTADGMTGTSSLRTDLHAHFVRASLEQKLFFQYKKNKRGVDMRLFGGTFFYRHSPTHIDGRFRLSGISGVHDYMFENIYIARSDNSHHFFANQMYEGDGYFKTKTPLGQTWKWLTALNIAIDFPTFLPLQWYVDVGTYAEAFDYEYFQNFPFNSGIAIVIKKNVLKIFIPILFSSDIARFYDINNIGLLNRITWTFEYRNLGKPEYKKQMSP